MHSEGRKLGGGKACWEAVGTAPKKAAAQALPCEHRAESLKSCVPGKAKPAGEIHVLRENGEEGAAGNGLPPFMNNEGWHCPWKGTKGT